ncbi:ATP-dependent endonuclease [Brachyspira aalborgi]|uniref:ATP-dependent endonuclease n=1 Tax=Brachyspira aalborgi TaxID=29522 RepID=A0A5C8F9A8_9SPIR|nr:AAA family ATPase [Brachyspira aalborgi]TXJ45691.1 ATP-dependent endonuclease [Brachyspira aalborgi]
MYIKTVKIQNFKCFRKFELNLNDDINIIVGNNEAGKSTLLEAIHLALTGVLDGKYLKNEINPYIFNNDAIEEYYNDIKKGLPEIIIELYFDNLNKEDIQYNECRGTHNSIRVDESGIQLKILFNDEYKSEYKDFIDSIKDYKDMYILPIEFYKIEVISFSGNNITYKKIPIKSILIDSSNNKLKNGSDIYISYIINKSLTDKEQIQIFNAHREMKTSFAENENIKKINDRIFKDNNYISSNKQLKLSVDFFNNNWESMLMPYMENIPFQYIGKGEQCYIKTNLALLHNKSQEASLILLEEPENHLSHSKLNSLLKNIKDNVSNNKQIIITTHSSFVANKMLLNNIIIINNNSNTNFKKLSEQTFNFFEKASGYDTLRLVLSKKTVLVEGDSDELIFQRAYKDIYEKLPIENEIDVISVGTAFVRYLELAKELKNKVIVIIDNDGNTDKLKNKYDQYNKYDNIKIYYQDKNNFEDFEIDINNNEKKINIDTLEPNLLKANNYDITLFNKIFGKEYTSIGKLLNYMLNNKVECALKIFEYSDKIKYPKYILEALNECE